MTVSRGLARPGGPSPFTSVDRGAPLSHPFMGWIDGPQFKAAQGAPLTLRKRGETCQGIGHIGLVQFRRRRFSFPAVLFPTAGACAISMGPDPGPKGPITRGRFVEHAGCGDAGPRKVWDGVPALIFSLRYYSL